MILVGIDVAKDKHDCCIINSDGEFPEEVFSILNNREGYETLYKRICSLAVDLAKVKVGLESTGHYSSNLLAFLLDKHLTAYVINPLRVNLFRKGQSLRRFKKYCSSAYDRFKLKALLLIILPHGGIKVSYKI